MLTKGVFVWPVLAPGVKDDDCGCGSSDKVLALLDLDNPGKCSYWLSGELG